MQRLFTACPAPQPAPASTEPRTRLPAQYAPPGTAPAPGSPPGTLLPRTQPVCPCNPSNFTVSKVAPAFPQVNFQHFPQNSKIFWFPTNPTPATPGTTTPRRSPRQAPPHHAVHHARHHHTTPFTTPSTRCSALAPRPTSRQPQLTLGAAHIRRRSKLDLPTRD